MQGDAAPGERDAAPAVLGVRPAEHRADAHAVQCRVQQGGVDAEPGGLAACVLGQPHLGVDLVVALPGRAQPLDCLLYTDQSPAPALSRPLWTAWA